jgi:hypothetical protein
MNTSKSTSNEISEKELNQLAKEVGDCVRAQTIDLKDVARQNLRREFASARARFFPEGVRHAET